MPVSLQEDVAAPTEPGPASAAPAVRALPPTYRPGDGVSSTGAQPGRAAPPLWPAEKFFQTIGRAPAAAGRFLDRLAAMPFPIGSIVRFFSSVWLGLLWLALVGVYVALGSGFPQLRSWADLSSLEFFDAWPMVTLMGLLSVTLIVVTLRRIPLTLYRAGVWMVHTGIITLIIGCFFYFGLKHEGMVRIFMHQTVGNFYGTTTRAFYVGVQKKPSPVDKTALLQSQMDPLRKLPIFLRYTPGHGNPLHIAYPTALLTKLSPALANTHVKIVGYLPYAEMVAFPVPRQYGVPMRDPAVKVVLSSGSMAGGLWLEGKNPSGQTQRSDQGLFDIEYLYHPSAEKMGEITAAFNGKHAVTVIIPKLHIDRTYVFTNGKPIAVKGSPYTITPKVNLGQMPMRTKGYIGAASSAYMFTVDRQDGHGKVFHFQRAALSRYPSKAADFIKVHGKTTPVFSRIDHNITLVYQDAMHEQLWVVEHKSGKFSLVHRAIGGAVTNQALRQGYPLPLVLDGIKARFELKRLAMMIGRPYTVPRKDRTQHATDQMQQAVMQLTVTQGKWRKRRVYVPFNQFGPRGNALPTRLTLPHGGTLLFTFSDLRRPLPSHLTLLQCKEVMWPGNATIARDFQSRIRIVNKKTGKKRIVLIHLNHPANDHGLHYFQARFGRNAGQAFTVLGVGNTHGMYAMMAGVVLIVLGIGYAFYIKPILLRIKKKQLAAYAASLKAP